MKETTVLVTGGTGFLGAYIIDELVRQGYAVRALRRNSSKLPFFIPQTTWDNVEWVEGDILDVVSLQDALVDVDAVIHSAAVVSFAKEDRRQMYQVNVDGTANVMNMALEAGVKRVVHISSVAALGRTADGGMVDEDKKWEDTKINTHYAKSKYRGELEVWRAMGEGLPAVILNPSTILGYGDWHSSSSAIFRNMYNGFPWYSPGINGFVAVKDVARATVAMLQNDITESRFIVNGDNWPFKKLLETIADGFNRRRPHRQTTPLLAAIAWRMEKIKSFFSGHKPLLTKESARVAHSKTRFNNQKILNTLPGFQFTPLEQAIHGACEQYKAQQGA
ncbi:MAG: 3-beta hydroxysteroid dehydrogenase [Sphingobacteriales bacterium SCN 48-20]|uniref:SDR family NAD(P)-dependent oxidoreductase n=1 Tax=Terrimonas ferruginea TaxID=249 RepID=UPI000868A0AC|nr:SDR family NAD(P)-dependent oxidoreductase [Terrimonas ferruginea]MBN8782301.1 SDR family NAD(P)-dependent oxidoreductase [Terrimonas ferruginea]ODT91614.1 MAG: 3-beta hydroxysteroid dehydrogenase [Sphingobacteriales bacterium SCN 48-20]OJW42823.1 MAG: 3-beta hydroxysteroid dehydrogenase [Sphingobacteriales bacterium 48-107]